MKALVVSLLLLGTLHANACAVCFRNNHARGAYLATTAVLMALPFAMVGGFIVVIRRRMK